VDTKTEQLLVSAVQKRLGRHPSQFHSSAFLTRGGWTEVVAGLRSYLRVKQYPYSWDEQPGIPTVSRRKDEAIPEATQRVVRVASDQRGDAVMPEGVGWRVRPPYLR